MRQLCENRQVVITGLGIISCLGLDCQQVQESLRLGRSGIALLPERKERGFRSALSGVIHGFDNSGLERRYRKNMPEFGQWAWASVEQALAQAGLSARDLAGDERCGLLFGNDSSVVTGVEQCRVLAEAGESRGIGSGHIFRLLNSTITLNLATKLQLHGSSWTVSGACASGAMAIGQAAELISSGKQDRMICGGAQEISWQSMCSFDGLGAFSLREDAPAAASRPFDAGRDGLVPSGGAAALVLEEKQHALQRGAPILAEIEAYAATSDGHHVSVPSGEGLGRAMAMALQQADLAAADIDLVMAHATSTQVGDAKEALALRHLFGVDQGQAGPVIAATKALTGHEFWMAGASQVVYGLLMSQGGFVAGHSNFQEADASARGLRIPPQTMELHPRRLLCNASGFGGVNAALVVRVAP
ncbi:MAG: beta-ketoacyl synthase N-terminal-like domain-containing protein [Desulfurivibrionaceae bacterium]|nr:beta-ketoacyl synthase N-terminal-like domain-containing protein [Desulfurivibrionaceae bacterium]